MELELQARRQAVGEHPFGQGLRLENAVHIPIEEIELRTEELNPDDEIVVYCHQGVRSAAVAQYLRQTATKNVVRDSRSPFSRMLFVGPRTQEQLPKTIADARREAGKPGNN